MSGAGNIPQLHGSIGLTDSQNVAIVAEGQGNRIWRPRFPDRDPVGCAAELE
jgi:hypothetical protein